MWYATMSKDTTRLSRRAVLRTACATATAGMALAGNAGATPNCVVTTTDADAYSECPGENYVSTVEEGTNGSVNKTCTDVYGNEWAEVTWECDETWTVSTDDIDEGEPCYC